eukprot:m51a1_g1867 hypothetical protein (675) ;mRNA; f:648911-657723
MAEQCEFAMSGVALSRISGPQQSDGPFLWLSTQSICHGCPCSAGIVVPSSWMVLHRLEPVDIRTAVLRSEVVLRGPKSASSKPVRRCSKCTARGRGRVLDIGGKMFESFSAASATREFVFESIRSSSRLHLGGTLELVVEIRGRAGQVVALLRSAPFSLVSKPPRPRPAPVGQQQQPRPASIWPGEASMERAVIETGAGAQEEAELERQVLQLIQLQRDQLARGLGETLDRAHRLRGASILATLPRAKGSHRPASTPATMLPSPTLTLTTSGASRRAPPAGPAAQDRIAGPASPGSDGPYLWLSAQNICRGTPCSAGVVVSAAWMEQHGLGPADIRSAVLRADVVLCSGSESGTTVRWCRKCYPRNRGRVVDVGRRMFETLNPSSSIREFVFESVRSSSRLHLGGELQLVVQIIGRAGLVVASLRSAPFSLVSRAPRASGELQELVHWALLLQELQRDQMARVLVLKQMLCHSVVAELEGLFAAAKADSEAQRRELCHRHELEMEAQMRTRREESEAARRDADRRADEAAREAQRVREDAERSRSAQAESLARRVSQLEGDLRSAKEEAVRAADRRREMEAEMRRLRLAHEDDARMAERAAQQARTAPSRTKEDDARREIFSLKASLSRAEELLRAERSAKEKANEEKTALAHEVQVLTGRVAELSARAGPHRS